MAGGGHDERLIPRKPGAETIGLNAGVSRRDGRDRRALAFCRERQNDAAVTVVHGDFEWDEAKAHENLVKHGVAFEEAATVFDDPNALDAPDMLHQGRFVIIGMSHRSRVLFVVHAERGEQIRLISARKASPAQGKKYEEGL